MRHYQQASTRPAFVGRVERRIGRIVGWIVVWAAVAYGIPWVLWGR